MCCMKNEDVKSRMSAQMAPVRLEQVAGFKERRNDVVYCKPLLLDSPSSRVVIFFPGDVQDYIENMEANPDIEIYKKWNLESCASDLQNKFAESHILVIRPCKLHCKRISCFGNFVTSSREGVPTHTPNYDSFRHLNRLLKGVEERFAEQTKEGSASEAHSQQGPNLLQLDLILIGFSKGCVVLNQLLYELHHFKTAEFDAEVDAVTGRIRDMFWLDGGHSGRKNTWVVDENVLQTLSLAGIAVHVVVTPYQIGDVSRPWIQMEEKLFSARLLEYNCKLERKQHFMNKPPSLFNHFRLLNVFESSLSQA